MQNPPRFLKILAFMMFFTIPVASVLGSARAFAQEVNPQDFPADEYYRAEVLSVQPRERTLGETPIPWQATTVQILSGEEKGREIAIEHGGAFVEGGPAAVKTGDTVVVVKTEALGEITYTIVDHYRIPSLVILVFIFFAVVAFFGRRHGIASIVGLCISIAIIGWWIVPQIAAGASPLLVSLAGALVIVLSSLYLAHGFNKRTSIALLGTLITLGLAVLAALAAVAAAKLFGIGTEETLALQLGPLENINFQGLLLGGIILGALGVLDDITTAQSATVDELHKANPALGLGELYRRGLSVGREHIASLVNTLFLAYAGAALPLFLIFSVNRAYPAWTLLNSEFIADEIVRTIVGSLALVLAVPITTFLAAYFFQPKRSV